MNVRSSKLIKFAKHAYQTASQSIPEYSSKYSRKDYTQWQHVALLCIKERTRQKWEEFPDLLENMPYLCEIIGLEKIPHFTTLNKFFLRLKGKMLLVMILMTAGRASGNASIDATGLDCGHNSKHYVKRCKITIKSMKTTLLIDTEEQKITNVNCTASRRHDSKLLLPLVKKTRQRIRILCGDKGYDDKEIRDWLREHGIRPLIPHREFKNIHKAQNERMNKKDYNQRVKNETINSVIKRCYRDFLSSHEFKNQKKEVFLLCIVYNIDRDVKRGLVYLVGFLKSFKCNCFITLFKIPIFNIQPPNKHNFVSSI